MIHTLNVIANCKFKIKYCNSLKKDLKPHLHISKIDQIISKIDKCCSDLNFLPKFNSSKHFLSFSIQKNNLFPISLTSIFYGSSLEFCALKHKFILPPPIIEVFNKYNLHLFLNDLYLASGKENIINKLYENYSVNQKQMLLSLLTSAKTKDEVYDLNISLLSENIRSALILY